MNEQNREIIIPIGGSGTAPPRGAKPPIGTTLRDQLAIRYFEIALSKQDGCFVARGAALAAKHHADVLLQVLQEDQE